MNVHWQYICELSLCKSSPQRKSAAIPRRSSSHPSTLSAPGMMSWPCSSSTGCPTSCRRSPPAARRCSSWNEDWCCDADSCSKNLSSKFHLLMNCLNIAIQQLSTSSDNRALSNWYWRDKFPAIQKVTMPNNHQLQELYCIKPLQIVRILNEIECLCLLNCDVMDWLPTSDCEIVDWLCDADSCSKNLSSGVLWDVLAARASPTGPPPGDAQRKTARRSQQAAAEFSSIASGSSAARKLV